MAPSQPVERQGIGGKSRQHAGAEQEEQKIEHGPETPKWEPCNATSGHQLSIRNEACWHKDFIKMDEGGSNELMITPA